jgi:multiple sugar transport system permease protein
MLDLSLRARERMLAYGLLLPALLIVVIFMAYPLYIVVDLSLRDAETMTLSELTNQPFTLGHYRNLLQDLTWVRDLWRSVVYTVGVIAPAFGLGVGLALLLNELFPGRRVLRPLVLLPWAVPGIAVAAGFRWILDSSYGVANYLLRSVGLISGNLDWFVSRDTAMLAVIIPTVWKYYPFFTLVVLAALQTVPADLYEAARVDGAGPVRRFRHITWPAIRSSAVLALIIGGLGVFREFDFIYPLTGGGPNGATQTLAIRIYDEAFRFFNLGDAAAIGMLTVAICGVVVLAMGRTMRREFF